MKVLENLFYAIKNKYIISIEYTKTSGQSTIQMVPITIFQHNKKEYLLGEETRTGIVKNYTLSNIDIVEITSLKFSKEFKDPKQLINKTFFKHAIRIIKNEKDIYSISKDNKNKYSNIITYMLESLRAEKINDISFHENSKEGYKLQSKNLIKVLKGHSDEISLPDHFKAIYNLWDKEIKRTPDLSIYIGYPLLMNQRKELAPIFYLKCNYDIDKNSITNLEKAYLNEKLCGEVIELTDEEIKEMISKELTIEDIDSLIDHDSLDYQLINQAYLFLHKDPLMIRSLLNDIKDIEKESIQDITKPLEHLLSFKKDSLIELSNRHPLMISQTNEAQESAVIKSQVNSTSVIQGPPGTGKTQTILNIIVNNFISGKTTLIASTNNKAVDNVLEKLKELDIPDFYLRLGNQEVIEHTKKNLEMSYKDLKVLKEERIKYAKELIRIQMLMNLSEENLSQLELNFDDTKEFSNLIKIFPIIMCTNLSIPNCIPKGFKFDMGIIDEASQCDIPATFPTIKRSYNLVIIGDDKQLNPITKINERLDDYHLQKYKVNNQIRYRDNSIFDVYKKISEAYTFLDRHYRCKNSIIQFSNEMFYDSKLKVMTTEDKESGISLMDVKGCTKYGQLGSKSGFNRMEIQAVEDYLSNLAKSNFSGTIGVITPFRRQKQLLEDKLINKKEPFYQQIDVGTVHTFQGHEKDLIIFSTVVSKNAKPGSIFWLNQMYKLLNVAITRAKNKFVLFCDEQVLLENAGILKELVLYIRQRGSATMYKPISIFETLHMFDTKQKNTKLKSLFNPYEFKLYQHLRETLGEKSKFRVYPKVRVADVIDIDQYKNKNPEKFSYGLKAHFDFVIFKDSKGFSPICAIELDGKQHSFDTKTIHRDGLKNEICSEMSLKLIRVKTNDTVDILKKIQDVIDDSDNQFKF